MNSLSKSDWNTIPLKIMIKFLKTIESSVLANLLELIPNCLVTHLKWCNPTALASLLNTAKISVEIMAEFLKTIEPSVLADLLEMIPFILLSHLNSCEPTSLANFLNITAIPSVLMVNITPPSPEPVEHTSRYELMETRI